MEISDRGLFEGAIPALHLPG